MTDVQRIVSALADCLHDNQISEDECLGVLKALRGIPPREAHGRSQSVSQRGGARIGRTAGGLSRGQDVRF